MDLVFSFARQVTVLMMAAARIEVPQKRNIFRSLTVEENLTSVARPGPWTRALVPNPKLLLLDEALEGLAPIIGDQLLRSIVRVVRDDGLSAIIVEQHPCLILGITEQSVVLDRGNVVHRAPSAELARAPQTSNGSWPLSVR